MFIQLDMDSESPIYTQLVYALIEGVAKSHLQPGDTLPSVRSLAADLSVNMHTVNKAYRELEKKGIVQIIPKSGVVVQAPPENLEPARLRITKDFRPIVAEALALGVPKQEILSFVDNLIHQLKEEVK
jgi:GntR family transcriptional regulator